MTHLEKRECEKAWHILWPWAKQGNAEARYLIAEAIAAIGLLPPGSNGDAISYWRHRYIMSVHGHLYEDGGPKGLIPNLSGEAMRRSRQRLSPVPYGMYDQCLADGLQRQVCVGRLLNFRYLPRFANYAREIDAAVSAGLGAAECSLDRGLAVYAGYPESEDHDPRKNR